MKKFEILLVIMMIVLCVSVVQAQERQLFKVTVAFDLKAENTSFSAGSYIVYLLNPYDLLRLQSHPQPRC